MRKKSAWSQSARFREIGLAAITEWNAKRALMVKCGAKRKRDGEPCQNLPSANGRCKCHGGRTPSGDGWHKPRWPNRDAADGMEKLDRKLKDQARAGRKRAGRLAAMTTEERERHENWHKARKPGAAVARQRSRDERRQNAEFRTRSARASAPPSPELQVIADELSDLRQRLAEIKTDKGVFS